MNFNKKDRVVILTGVYAEKFGTISTIVPKQDASVGVLVDGLSAYTTWFRPTEIAQVKS